MPYNRYPYELPPLPYPYNALEPYIDEETMLVHHDKLFAGFVTLLNGVLKPYPKLQKLSLEQLLVNPNILPKNSRLDITRYAGGVYNHILFFAKMAPPGENQHNIPTGKLMQNINKTFGSFDKFKALFSQNAAAVFGSGYTFLVKNRHGGLKIINTRNQETPLRLGYSPIIILDVWEHGYFLKYKERRDEYINNFWDIVVFDEN